MKPWRSLCDNGCNFRIEPLDGSRHGETRAAEVPCDQRGDKNDEKPGGDGDRQDAAPGGRLRGALPGRGRPGDGSGRGGQGARNLLPSRNRGGHLLRRLRRNGGTGGIPTPEFRIGPCLPQLPQDDLTFVFPDLTDQGKRLFTGDAGGDPFPGDRGEQCAEVLDESAVPCPAGGEEEHERPQLVGARKCAGRVRQQPDGFADVRGLEDVEPRKRNGVSPKGPGEACGESEISDCGPNGPECGARTTIP